MQFGGRQLAESATVRLLGYTLACNLLPTSHIQKVISKFKSQLFLLRRMKPFLTKEGLLVLYKAFVRSHVEYCGPLWTGGPQRLLNKLEALQSKAAQNFFKGCKLQSLTHRRAVSGFCLLFRVVRNLAPSPLLSLARGPPSVRRVGSLRTSRGFTGL